jgi:rhodanese-related sulfurtransferase
MNDLGKQSLKRLMLEALLIVVLTAVVGLVVNFRMVINSFSGRVISKVSGGALGANETASAVEYLLPIPIALDELEGLLAEGAVLIDARNVQSYAAGHLPRALSIPFAEELTNLSPLTESVPTDTTVVTYCSGYNCIDSFNLGTMLMKVGYEDVLVYEGGFPEWHAAGREIEKVEQ